MLLSLCRESIRLGHEVAVGTIVSPDDRSNELAELAISQGLRSVEFRMRDGIDVRGVGEIVEHVCNEQIDVVHSHGYKANALMAIFAARRRRWATTCTLHGWTSCKPTDRRKVYEYLERRVIGRIDHVVTVNDAIARKVWRRSLGDRVEVIANGVDVRVERLRPTERGRARDGVQLGLLAAGRLSLEKGFDLLIEAIGMLRGRGILVRVHVAGEGPERPRLEQRVAQLELESLVKFLGYNRDMQTLYANADCLVLSSRSEGLPMVVLESMAHRLPVVATPVGDVPNVLLEGKLGFLAESPSAESIAAAIGRAATSTEEDRLQMAERAYERVRDTYSIESSARRYSNAYATAMARRQRYRYDGLASADDGSKIG